MWLSYWKKQKQNAYISRVFKFLLCGMLGVPLVGIIEGLLMLGLMQLLSLVEISSIANNFIISFVESFLVASICEELFKYMLAILVTVKPGREVPFSLVIYSMSGAVGMASFENMMYILNLGLKGSALQTGITSIARGILAVPLHCCTGALIGVGVAKKRFKFEEISFFRILLLPVLIHGFYDFFAIFSTSYYLETNQPWIFFLVIFSVVAVLFGVILARKQSIALLTGYTPVNNTSNV